jgi:hypothetical protein
LQALIDFDRAHNDTLLRDNDLQRLLLLTTMRSNNTALAVAKLLVDGQIEQAQMLCRPLFEDMAVAHWLFMQADPTFLIERFFDHQDAMMVRDHDYFTGNMRLPYDDRPGLEQAIARRDELVSTFGRHAERSWWAARADGTSIKMSGVVAELENHPEYAPRLHGGDEPVLRDTYSLATMWANQQLHHTGRGLVFAMERDGVSPRSRERLHALTAVNAYWTYGHDTMSAAFVGGMSLDEARAELAEARRCLDAAD